MTKRYPVCSHCGSRNVMVDAWAAWSQERQEWVLLQALDHPAFCDSCGGQTSLEWAEDKTGMSKAETDNQQ